jgi:hypothetical protein
MTPPSRIQALTSGCHQNHCLDRKTILAKPLPIGIQQGPNNVGQRFLPPGSHVNYREKSFGPAINAEYPQRGRR